jgi:hypothetical protein
MADNKEGFIGIRLNSTLKSLLQSMAEREGRTLSNYIERLLERHIVDTQQSGPGGILSALLKSQTDEGERVKYIDAMLEKHLDPKDVADHLQARHMYMQMQRAKPKKK